MTTPKTFKVNVLKPPNLPLTIDKLIKGLTNTGPPSFESTPVSYIKVVVGNPLVYQLPNFSDPDNDDVDIFLEFMATRHFCTFFKGKLTFNP